MTTFTERKDQVATWNGDPTTWLEYVKRVRLQYERTEHKRRHLLGAELASRLTGKAWDIVSAEISHSDLQQRDGPAYLLRFLEERLCKAPVPDTGQRLEDLFVRLKRSQGTTMAEWATALRESYRRLQRAMARQRQDLAKRDGVSLDGPSSKGKGASRAGSGRDADVTSPRAGGDTPGSRRSNPGRGVQERPDDPRTDGYEPVPTEDAGNDGNPGHETPEGQRNNGEWTDEEWAAWRRWRPRYGSDWDDNDWWKEDDIQWDQFDFSTEQILPQEILGWILLRRSGLPASARLSVLSATNNRLDLDSMERAMRDQEEELLAAESNRLRHDHHQRPRRTYWVEQDSQWGIMPDPDADDVDEALITWIGDTLPPEVYAAASQEHDDHVAWSTWLPDGQELAWEWSDDDFYAQDAAGIYWSWAETKTWLDMQESGSADQPLQEAFVAFQDRFRTFKESRALNAAKHVSRGFYPIAPLKGKFKGKPKGMGKGKFSNKSSSSSTSATAPAAMFNSGNTGKGTQRPGNPAYRGCFICGSQEHDFRRCPKRQSGSSSLVSSASPGIYFASDVFTLVGASDEMEKDGPPEFPCFSFAGDTGRLCTPDVLAVTNAEEEEGEIVLGASPDVLAAMSSEYPGHAVLDSGATESIASLEALEEVMVLRGRTHGPERVVVHQQEKRFRFGNGTFQKAVSFVEVPQVINGQHVPLGVHALDAPGIPLLISVKTLTKLKAVLDFEFSRICFKSTAPDVWIPLKRAANGHLLLDLTQDWVPMSTGAVSCMAAGSDASKSDAQYKGAAAVCERHDTEHVQGDLFQGFHRSSPSSTCMSADAKHASEFQYVSAAECFGCDEMKVDLPVLSTASIDAAAKIPENGGNINVSNATSGSSMLSTLPLLVAAAAVTSTSSPSSPLLHGPVLDSGCRAATTSESLGTSTKGEVKVFFKEGTSADPRAIRHESPGGCGWQRSPSTGVSLLRTTLPDAGGQRILEWAECPRQMDNLFTLPFAPGVHSKLRRDRELQTGRTSPSRCSDRHGGSAERCQERTPSPRGLEQSRSGGSWRRSVDAKPLGEAGARQEGAPHQDSGSPRIQGGHQQAFDPDGRLDRRLSDEDSSRQESPQEGERGGGGSGRVPRLVRGVKSFTSDTSVIGEKRLYEIVDEHVPDEIYYNSFACLSESQRSAMEDQAHDLIHEINGTYDEIFATTSRLDLMEVCCPPDSRLTQTFLDPGRSAIRIGLPAFDLSTNKGSIELNSMIQKHRPRLLWISLPCGPYSPIQSLFNEKSEEQLAKSLDRKRKARKLIRNGIKAARLQLDLGGDVAWEWPGNNGGWHLSEMKAFLDWMRDHVGLSVARIHGCAYGLLNSKGVFLKKPWNIATSSPSLAAGLSLQCPGDHTHAECLGGQDARDSGFYPKKMCERIYKLLMSMVQETTKDAFPKIYPVFDEEILDDAEKTTNSVQPLSEAEIKQATKTLHKLHRRTGHPSNQALASVLKHRGAHPEVVEMARKHQCPECQELRLAASNPSGALQRSETLWETLVIDNAEFPVDEKVIHCMIMVDEASRLVCPHFLFEHPKEQSRNCTGAEAVAGIQNSWVRHYGAPAAIRLDPEGAFKSWELTEWAQERSIEILPCAAEAHHQISLVERMIQTIKQTVKQILQAGQFDAWDAVVQACQTHNEFERVSGYSPYQWAFGRQPSLSGRFHDKAPDDPFWTSSAVPGTQMAVNLKLRHQAQNAFLKQQSYEQITRAANAKTRRLQVFLPGDLVFFKRIKPPAQPMAAVRMPHKLWRWYGPGRVLATETRTDALGHERKPSHIVWVVTHGRLKRCSPEQLRHASDREKVLAESAESPTTSWTFHSLSSTLYKGEYEILDDMVLPEDEVMQGPPRESRRGRSATPSRQPKTPVAALPSRAPSTPAARGQPLIPVPATPRQPEDPAKDERTMEELLHDERATSSSTRRPLSRSTATSSRMPKTPKVNLPQYLKDPAYDPEPMSRPPRSTSELFQQPLFKKARKELQPDDSLMVEEAEDMFMCCFDLPVPQKAGDWKRLKRSPEGFYAKKVKSVEVKWHTLSPEDKVEFNKAKMTEVNAWLSAMAVRKASADFPRERLMRMRWVLTRKDDGSPKGRIVLIGYEDPDLQNIQSAAPTMSRRTRQLGLQFSSIKRWRVLKADVKAAFLQGGSVEELRDLFAMPVPELAEALGLKEGEAVQILKSCYGLVHAPAKWYECVRDTLLEIGFHQSRADPCLWLYYTTNSEGVKQTSGYVCSHVDDFIISGDEDCDAWVNALNQFYNRFKWSPWECNSFMHCGVRVREEPDFSFTLDHSSFCEKIEAISYTTKNEHDKLTADEITQLRGVLGALQWRGQQTAPHLMAKIGQLQSAVPKANLDTLKAANKLVRECFQTRYMSTKINQLHVDDPKNVQFVTWCDAALANRIDLSSTGGYVIAAVGPEMTAGKRSPLTLVSWRSCRLPRKARSSLAAEAQAMAEADQELVFVRLAWAEFCALDVDLANSAATISQVPGTVVTDAKALYDILLKRDMNSAGVGLKDKYSALEILCLLESIEKMRTSVRWVHSDAQLADHLTKPLPIGTLHKVLNEGFWTLVYDPDFTSAKRLKRAAKNENSNQNLRGMSESELDSRLHFEPDHTEVNMLISVSHSGPIPI